MVVKCGQTMGMQIFPGQTQILDISTTPQPYISKGKLFSPCDSHQMLTQSLNDKMTFTFKHPGMEPCPQIP